MANSKISGLTAATTPLAGTEELALLQTSDKRITVANFAAGAVKSNATTGVLQVVGPVAASTRVMTTPDANFSVARIDASQTFTGAQTVNNRLITGLYNGHFFGEYGCIIGAGAANVNFLTITFPAGTYGASYGAAIVRVTKSGAEHNVTAYSGIVEYYVVCNGGTVTITVHGSTGTEASLYITHSVTTDTAIFSFVASSTQLVEHTIAVDVLASKSAYAEPNGIPIITLL